MSAHRVHFLSPKPTGEPPCLYGAPFLPAAQFVFAHAFARPSDAPSQMPDPTQKIVDMLFSNFPDPRLPDTAKFHIQQPLRVFPQDSFYQEGYLPFLEVPLFSHTLRSAKAPQSCCNSTPKSQNFPHFVQAASKPFPGRQALLFSSAFLHNNPHTPSKNQRCNSFPRLFQSHPDRKVLFLFLLVLPIPLPSEDDKSSRLSKYSFYLVHQQKPDTTPQTHALPYRTPPLSDKDMQYWPNTLQASFDHRAFSLTELHLKSCPSPPAHRPNPHKQSQAGFAIPAKAIHNRSFPPAAWPSDTY